MSDSCGKRSYSSAMVAKVIMKAVQALENQDKIDSGLASGHPFRHGLIMWVHDPGPEAKITS